MADQDAYDALMERYERLTHLQDAAGVLSWDQQVTMPDGGAPARAAQQSALSGVTHDLLTDDEVGEWLDALEGADLSEDEAAEVREIRKQYESESRVPGDLVETITETSSEAQQIWRDARADDDFDAFAPTLAEIRDLHIERAENIDTDREPYRVMFEGVDPDIELATVEDIFDDLREALVPLIDDLRSANADLASVPEVDADDDAGEDLALEEAVLDDLAYDRDRGRLDTSPHPFTFGTQFDCRITTWEGAEHLGSLMATIHEYGHASYQLGLPQDDYGSPLGQARGEIHESQSRFWENHVGRTEAFWEYFAPTFNEHLGTSLSPRECFEAANRIYPENLIRVEADELTYHLHIIRPCLDA
jgi:carboxypeptidase Taq